MYFKIVFSILYYTDNGIRDTIANICLSNLIGISNRLGAELVAVSWKPIPVKNNIIWNTHTACHENIYKQIMAGINHCHYEKVFLAEHDVLYPLSHFDLIPSDKIIYDTNVYHMNKDGFFKAPPVNFLSTLVADKLILDRGLREKIREINRTGKVDWAEPRGPNGFERIKGVEPIIDIRHGSNLTGMRTSEEYLKEIPYWGKFERFGELWSL